MYVCHFWVLAVFCLSSSVFADLKEDIEQATQCLNDQHVKGTEMFKEIYECYKTELKIDDKFPATSTTEEIIKKVCSIKDPINCITEHTEFLLQTCLTAPSLIEVYNKSVRIIDMVYRYACHEEGKRITDFINSGGAGCVAPLFSVANSTSAQCVETKFTAKMNEFEALGYTKEKFHEITCKLSYEVKNCITEDMTSCSKPKEILEGLFNELAKSEDCSKYLPVNGGQIQVPYILTFLFSSLLVLMCHP